jgi:hypothetical protein
MQHRLTLAAAQLLAAGTLIVGTLASPALADDQGKDNKGPNFSSRHDNPDGSTLYTVGTQLPTEFTTTDWSAKVGVDVGVPGNPRMTYDPTRPLPGSDPQQPGGSTGWASIGTPSIDTAVVSNKASLDAKLDPLQEQSRLGTRFNHSVPLGKDYTVSLENGYSVTRTMESGSAPIAAAPGTPQEFWTTDHTLKLDVLGTGTSFLAGTSVSTADNVTHQKVGAEQKLFGAVSVKTTISDFNTPTPNKSITAGWKKTW